jgi:hypothetical protein
VGSRKKGLTQRVTFFETTVLGMKYEGPVISDNDHPPQPSFVTVSMSYDAEETGERGAHFRRESSYR